MKNPITIITLLCSLFILNSSLVVSQTDEFFYNGFSSNRGTPNLSLNGIAEVERNGILQLTNQTGRFLGHAFHPHPIPFKNATSGASFSFSTVFAISIVPEYPRLGGHGLAFAISPTKRIQGTLPRQFLGLLNSTDMGDSSNHLFAVEFDTVKNLELDDINDNHVGINVNSLISDHSAAASYVGDNGTKVDLNLMSGKTIKVWIEYDSMTTRLNVTLSPSDSKPVSPLLSVKLDLSPVVLDSMYLGFSASTGLLASSHYVFGWSFKMNGIARRLDVSSLPSLPRPKKKNTALTVGIAASAGLILIVVIMVAIYIFRKVKNADVVEKWEHDVGPHRFSYKELKHATKGFRDECLLGSGGFGRVYQGILSGSKTQVAVKRFCHESKQGLREFLSEIATIGCLRHRNLVQLHGWCRRRGDLLLVYEFMPNGSLDKFLFDKPIQILNWEQRVKIIKDVASGILYLHEGWEKVVVHRDIKASNVLLDSELHGRVGDFGLARLYEHGSNPSTTRVVGTIGYLAPELARTGKGTSSSDVFSFGAFLLEVACGRRPMELKASAEELILVDWLWEKWRDGKIFDVVDPRLEGDYDEGEVVLVLKLALMCSSSAPSERPTMRQVVRCLDGEISLADMFIATDYEPGKVIEERFEAFDHSYPSSMEKVSSSVSYYSFKHGAGDGEVAFQVEGSSASPTSLLSDKGTS